MELKIAICGGARVGKDTVSNYAESEYGMIPFAFGDELKNEFHEEYPHIKRNPKPRKGYQLYGQLQRYVHGEGYWLDKCFDKIQKTRLAAREYNQSWQSPEGEKPPEPFRPIITDLRQPNEFERCLSEGFVIIRVESYMENRLKRMEEARDKFTPEDLHHETEKYIQDFDVDYVIENNGTLKELHEKFDRVVQDIVKSSLKGLNFLD